MNQPFATTSVSMSLLSALAYVVGTIAFCLLLKRIGSNISSKRLKKSSHSTLIWFILLNVVSVLGVILIAAFAFLSVNNGGLRGPTNSYDTALSYLMTPFFIAMFVLGLGTLFQFLSMLRNGIDELRLKTNE